MRILFDAFWWSDGPPSGRNVLTSLVVHWLKSFPSDEVTLAVPAKLLRDEAARFPDGARLRGSRVPQHGVSTVFELGSHGAFDVIISQNFTPIQTRALRVTFLHDVMFQEHAEWFTRAERLYLASIPRLARRADLVLTSSRSERARIERLNPPLAGRTTDVGLGVADSFSAAEPMKPALALQPGRYLLAVGRVNVRKNLERLIAALAADGVISAEFPLVVVGAENGFTDEMPQLAAAAHAGSVLRSGYLSDSELSWLYSHCASFVFPSLDEGFGLPILEAAHSGAPMALSRIPAFEEFGAIGTFFDPLDAAAIAAGVRESIAGGARTEAAALAGRYSWQATVGRIRELIVREGVSG